MGGGEEKPNPRSPRLRGSVQAVISARSEAPQPARKRVSRAFTAVVLVVLANAFMNALLCTVGRRPSRDIEVEEELTVHDRPLRGVPNSSCACGKVAGAASDEFGDGTRQTA